MTVRDVDRAARYYQDNLGLQPLGKANGGVLLRIDHAHHGVALYPGQSPGVHHPGSEELVVVMKGGCEVITNFPSDHVISCGLPGCEVYN